MYYGRFTNTTPRIKQRNDELLLSARHLNKSGSCFQARDKQAAEGRWGQAPWNCVRIIGRSSLASRIAVCVCLSGFVALGFLEMLSQYLELKLQYTKLDLVSTNHPALINFSFLHCSWSLGFTRLHLLFPPWFLFFFRQNFIKIFANTAFQLGLKL